MIFDRFTALGAKNMHNHRLGFTLMEIMVVVVIIAVLASVAGPMIGDIVNQGKASATRSKLSALKSAIITYRNDVGRYPYYGDKTKVSSTAAYNIEEVLSTDETKNVLVNRETKLETGDGTTCGTEIYSNYYGKLGRKWKGPYMDSDPADFMLDAWGKEFRYLAFNNSLILWSAGPDGEWDEISPTNNEPNNTVMNSDAYAEGDTDDLYISIARFRKKFVP